MEAKPRYRVKAITVANPAVQPPSGSSTAQQRFTARYLRGDKAGILGMRRAITRDAKRDVREAADRASALATDFLHNSGWIAGAVTQILSDTIGEELKLNCRAQLKKFGYTDEEAAEWCRNVEKEWRRWAWNPKECDLAGKATIAEMLEAVLRSYLVSGEAFGILDNLPLREQRRMGLKTGTKVSLTDPHRLPRDTREAEGLEQGIFQDAYGRALTYRFRAREGGIETDRDIDAADVIHVMDRGENLNSARGISVLAAALKVIAQSDQLADATLATALMQTIFAATIKSPEASAQAFEAISTLSDIPEPDGFDHSDGSWNEFIGGIQNDLLGVWDARLGALREKGISMSDSARINHLGPGEEFQMHTASTPGSQYLPFFQNLLREVARCLGITFENLTMDHSSASYSSVRMSVASIWPIVLRRRARIAAPFVQAIFERWLEEKIERGQIPFKGGAIAFRRDRESVFQAEWSGPAAPSADDYKAAMAQKVRLEIGTATFFDECAMMGRNGEEQIVQLGREIKMFEAEGVPHPFGRAKGGGGGPDGAAVEGNREPAKQSV
ncbi:phage portal protein [Rhizobium leguminosarum]|uniref:phage portal protein n=1 Tax=Rhizobium leguminosarum TaxID=384 RepID=UPI00103CDF72|nr:phage portal protein [Rhizobium leguminosarum]TCA80202.1 phage portal protein [Rhizobium leguminosarum bv. viciae]TCA91102.1 phage portal protein [Rhizobium leguminosarum bv. viciae]